jgi:hypothetical protein
MANNSIHNANNAPSKHILSLQAIRAPPTLQTRPTLEVSTPTAEISVSGKEETSQQQFPVSHKVVQPSSLSNSPFNKYNSHQTKY